MAHLRRDVYSAVEYGSGFGHLGQAPTVSEQFQIIVGTDGLIYLYDPTLNATGLGSPGVFSVIGDVASGIYESARGAVGGAVGDILDDPDIGAAIQRAIDEQLARTGAQIYESIPVEYREPIERQAIRQRVTELAQVVPGGFAGIGGGAILLGALAFLFFMR